MRPDSVAVEQKLRTPFCTIVSSSADFRTSVAPPFTSAVAVLGASRSAEGWPRSTRGELKEGGVRAMGRGSTMGTGNIQDAVLSRMQLRQHTFPHLRLLRVGDGVRLAPEQRCVVHKKLCSQDLARNPVKLPGVHVEHLRLCSARLNREPYMFRVPWR